MNIKYVYILLLGFITISCNTANKKDQQEQALTSNEKSNELTNGLSLLKAKCYACHSVTSKSHDEIIAPPMAAVKRRYKMSYASEEEFVEAITSWVMNPEKENVLMRGAVQQFNIMPKQPFDKEEISSIAKYMFENELETPSWFQKHFKEEHPNGMGKSNGENKKYN